MDKRRLRGAEISVQLWLGILLLFLGLAAVAYAGLKLVIQARVASGMDDAGPAAICLWGLIAGVAAIVAGLFLVTRVERTYEDPVEGMDSDQARRGKLGNRAYLQSVRRINTEHPVSDN